MAAFSQKRPDWPAEYTNVVIAVDDVQAAMRQVTEAGGNVLGEPIEIPGVGQYVSFFDTEGNRVSMLQPIPRNSTCAEAGIGRTEWRLDSASPPACGSTARLRKRCAGSTASLRTVPVHGFETPICAYAAMGIGPSWSARTWAGVR